VVAQPVRAVPFSDKETLTMHRIKLVAALLSVGAVATTAVHKYVIVNISQIKPSVVAQLRRPATEPVLQPSAPAGAAPTPQTGSPGPAGLSVTGPIGPAGPAGPIGESVTGERGPQGLPGVAGPEGKASTVPGPQGERGEVGPKATFTISQHASQIYVIASEEEGVYSATCEVGEQVVGGGYEVVTGASTPSIRSELPNQEARAWVVGWTSEPGRHELRVYAMCAS
jgi:hypothetical protein